jgi:hypothetical protein
MVVLTEKARWGEAIMSEGNFHISRENVPVADGVVIAANSIFGKLAVAAGVVVSQSYAGTGNGVLTLANPAVNSKVVDGVYKVTFITAAANAGTFRVERPDGTEVGVGTVGVAFNKEVKFTIADGATDFIVGDSFSLNVQADAVDFTAVTFNPAGTDGSEIPVGYAPYGTDTLVGVNREIAGLVRNCELNGNCIAWPAGITDAQKADAIQALATTNVIVRY